MSYQLPSGGSRRGRSLSKSCRDSPAPALRQPTPAIPGITKQVVREHARRIFRDKWAQRALSLKEWRLAEEDLVRKLETEAL